MQPRVFSLSVIGFTLALVAAAWTLGWWLQPVYGDLTRLGGYAERHFGWNQPVLEFDPLPTTFGEWKHPVDILVIGDSFANLRPAQQWQNHLAMQTGWSVHTLDVQQVDLDALIASPLFLEHPPKVVIWNVVERNLADDHATVEHNCAAYRTGPPVTLPAPAALAVSAHPVLRPGSLFDVNPGFARIWLHRAALRALFGRQAGDTVHVELARADLFSSHEPAGLLVYKDDFRKASWNDEHLRRIRCALVDIAMRFQANGKTKFMSALAPDKSSAYRAWARDPTRLPPARLLTLLDGLAVPDARLDLAVSDAVARGLVDIYMPDDTHWSSAGHLLAARVIMERLLQLRGAPAPVQGSPSAEWSAAAM
ncbi:MAG TPA: hypothetical protein PKW99_11535 [Thauera sp.]|nr:hypothetical protein [Thauera sp.]